MPSHLMKCFYTTRKQLRVLQTNRARPIPLILDRDNRISSAQRTLRMTSVVTLGSRAVLMLPQVISDHNQFAATFVKRSWP